MQPYLFPYAGYFRLLASTDLFVVYDCVQFVRRSRIHRCELKDVNNRKHWLTMPLEKQARDIKIKDLRWADDYQNKWEKRCLKFPIFGQDECELAHITRRMGGCTPLQFIAGNLANVRTILDIECPMQLSSQSEISADIHGQDRIIAICKEIGATTYVNSSGGRKLYDERTFSKHGIKLEFLPDFENKKSILDRLCNERASDIRAEIYDNI